MDTKLVNCDYYEVHLVGDKASNLDNQIDYDALIGAFPDAFGDIKLKQFGNANADHRNITMGDYVLRLDKIQKDDRNNFLRMHFHRLSHKDLAQAQDNKAGSQELQLRDDHTYIADGAVLVIDVNKNKALFQVNGRACRMSKVEEYINHFWHANGQSIGSFQFFQIQNDVGAFVDNLKQGKFSGTKKIEIKLSHHTADIPDQKVGDPLKVTQNYLNVFNGANAQVIVSKGRGEEYLDDTAVASFADFVADNPEVVKRARIEYLDEEERPSLLDLLNAKKRDKIEVNVTENGYVNLDEVESALIAQYRRDLHKNK